MLKINEKIFIVLVTMSILSTNIALAQRDGDAFRTYSPYTLYGIGDMYRPGSVANKAMGGLTYGVRDPLGINSYNPAALSIQDSLVVMLDFAAGSKNTYSKSLTSKTSANAFYFDYVDFSLRIAPGLTINVGLSPVSDIGYDIERKESDPYLIYQKGDIKYSYAGEGGINQLHWGAGYKLFSKFSVGVNMHYYFGSINRYYSTEFITDPTLGNLFSDSKTKISKIGFTLGAQYHTRLNGKTFLTVGAIYQPKTILPTRKETTTITVGETSTDTARNVVSSVKNIFMPETFGIGFTLRKTDKLMIGADYSYQDWSGFNFDGKSDNYSFSAGKSHIYNLGFEYTPRINNIKNNFKRWNYRAGLRYVSTFMNCNGQNITEQSLFFGVGIPLTRRFGSKVNAAFEVGQRGTTKNGLVKETFVTFSIGINIFDIWFQKFQFN
ncbi:MAG: hypothetical protein LBT27_09340 [Prevotellaceae bacterium]|jgi:long-subunit fatty acid transport protein|nr:hypothetical protein [Prevotellaceae bacterium]